MSRVMPVRRGWVSLIAPALAAALTLAGCSGGATTSPPAATGLAPSAPSASGDAACAAAPPPPADLPDWGQPATTPTVLPLLINGAGQLVCGENRVLFTLIDPDGRPIGAPDREVDVAFYNLGREAATPISSQPGEFVWAIEGARGIYVAHVTFPESGQYGAAFTTAVDGAPQTLRLRFDVQASTPAIRIGDQAPASVTPTLADVAGDPTRISTDPSPDPALYETSVATAVAEHEPFALIFATPKFCVSAQCGPTLDRIKPFVERYPSVTFINVEPYRLKVVDGVLQADLDAGGQLQTTPAADDWRLLVEPAVFVVDRDGIVRATFDLIFSDAELAAALDAVR